MFTYLNFVRSNDSIGILIATLIRLRFQSVFMAFSKEFLNVYMYIFHKASHFSRNKYYTLF